MIARAALVLALLLLAPACSLTASESGTFSATIRGAFARDLDGSSRYERFPDGAVVALLPGGTNQGSQILIDLTTASLRVGTYTITPEVGVAAVNYEFPALIDGRAEAVLFRATAGTLTISAASNERIAGSFDVTATEQDPGQPGTTTPEGARELAIVGSFDTPRL